MKKAQITELLNNDEKLNDYLISLQDELDKSDEVSEKLNTMINNVFELTDNFKDRRSLKAQLITSINELLSLKQQINNDKIKNSKIIFDMAKSKRDLELKAKQAEASQQIATGTGNILLALLNRMDKVNIYPKRLTDEELNEYKIVDPKNMSNNEIIDVNIKDNTINNKEENSKQIEIKDNKISLLELQKQLDQKVE